MNFLEEKMDKKNYLDLLKYYLKDFPDNVIEDIIIDYDQHFAEGIQNGKTEEQISQKNWEDQNI